MPDTAHPVGAQTVQRAVRILKLLARQPHQGFRLLDISNHMGLERPTAHRVLQALTAEGLLARTSNKRYRIGPLLFELALMCGAHGNLATACTPILQELAETTGDTSFFFVRLGDDALCLAREQGSYHIQTPVIPVGERHPLGVSAGGLAILAGLEEEEVEGIISDLEVTLRDFNDLNADGVRAHYKDARARGHAVIANRAAPGVRGVGVPVRNILGRPVAAVTVATTTERMSEERIASVAPLLHEAAHKLTALLP